MSRDPYHGTPPFVAGSATGEAAAASVANDKNRMRLLVYGFLVRRGRHGATDEEIQRLLPMRANTERPRRRELVLQGRVVDSGHRRATASGRHATVWAVPTTDGATP